MSNTQTIYFPADGSRVTVEKPTHGCFMAYLPDDVDEENGHIRVYGIGDTVLSAIADLNNELEQVQ
jgi:hypothetical protein